MLEYLASKSGVTYRSTTKAARLLRGRPAAMYPPVWQTAASAHVISAAATTYGRRGVLAFPSPQVYIPVTVEDVQARDGVNFARAMRMPADAVQNLVAILRPRLPRRGLSPLCRTAITLRYLGGAKERMWLLAGGAECSLDWKELTATSRDAKKKKNDD